MTSHEQMQHDRHKRDKVIVKRKLEEERRATLRECLRNWDIKHG